MGKPRQRAVDIPGLQHQSGRCGSRASGRASKESITNGERPPHPVARSIPHELANWIMVATNDRTVTVFGGTGFLGRRIVRHLRSHGFPVRTASRHPDRGLRLFGPDDPQLQSVRADIHDNWSVAEALAGAYGVVNAVGLYVEHGQDTFHSVHVEAA